MTPGPPHQLNATPTACSAWFCWSVGLCDANATARSRSYTGLLMCLLMRSGPAIPAGAAHDLSRFCAGVRAVVNHLDAVDQHGRDAGRELVRLFERGIVGDRRGIEDEDVLLHPLLDEAAGRDRQARRDGRGRLAHRIFEGDHVLVAHVSAEQTRVVPVRARVD